MSEVYGITVPDDDPWFENMIKQGKGIFDRASFEMCLRHIKCFRTALDIGAHYGTWAVGLANCGFENVHTFEPIKEIYDVLEINAAPYNNIHTHNFGLSDKYRTVTFNAGADNTGQSHVHYQHGRGNIPLKAVDSMEFHDVDFIKMDVEGYELFALNGAIKTLKKYKPLLCIELNGLSSQYNISDYDVIAMIKDIGYHQIDKCNKDHLFAFKQ